MTASNAKTPAIFTRLTCLVGLKTSLPCPRRTSRARISNTIRARRFCYSAALSAVWRKKACAIYLKRTGIFCPWASKSSRWSYLPEKTEGDRAVCTISFGGCGLSMSVPDLAKFAEMLLNMGRVRRYAGFARFMDTRSHQQANQQRALGPGAGARPDGYGYLIWLGPNGTYMFYGSYPQGSLSCLNPRRQNVCHHHRLMPDETRTRG